MVKSGSMARKPPSPLISVPIEGPGVDEFAVKGISDPGCDRLSHTGIAVIHHGFWGIAPEDVGRFGSAAALPGIRKVLNHGPPRHPGNDPMPPPSAV